MNKLTKTRITFAKEPNLDSNKPFKNEAAYAVERDACYDKFLFIVYGNEQSVAVRKKDVLSVIDALQHAVDLGWTT